jgi:tetratricopeptide (TPR) repeat protein
VLITSATHRLLSGLFVVEESGAQQLKGVSSPVELYRVLRPTGVRSRIGARGLTPFIGREEELRLLLSRWQQVREGEGQVALVIGEAGIGKSRLIAEFRERIRDTPHTWVESAGEQLFENSPFHAVTEMLAQWLELQAGTDVGEHLSHLERALALAGLKLAEAAPLIGDLLQLPLGERYPPLSLTPEQKRRRLLAALAEWLFGAARLQPVVMVVEDLHWLDPSTLDLQQVLAEQGATVPLMLLYTARPEFRAQWPLRAHHTQVTLNRLSTRNVRNLVLQVVAHNTLSEETLAAVVERTGGVPLFVEELTRAVLEGGDAKSVGRQIPVTLHDSLMARIDRLGPAKEIMQIASVIGSEFSYELLQAVHRVPDDELQRDLRSLTDAELLYVRGIAPDAIYQFKHALIRDAAYEALLKSRRRDLHRLVASTITEKFPAFGEENPEILARHWTNAGEMVSAISSWQRAANMARSRSAFKEAAESYRQALSILSAVPESPDRDDQELRLTSAFAGVLQVIKGYTAPETSEANQRARLLAEKTGRLAEVVPQLNGAFAAALISGDFLRATALADQTLDSARRDGSPLSLAFAYMDEVLIHFYRGNLSEVEENFAKGEQFFEVSGFRKLAATSTSAFGLAGVSAWTMGQPEVAQQRLYRAMTIACDKNSPYDLAYTCYLTSWVHCWAGRIELAHELAARAIALCDRHGFPYFGGLSRFALGFATAHLGRTGEGIKLIRDGVERFAAMDAHLGLTQYITWLAEALRLHGDEADALATIGGAFQANPDELIFIPEAFRVRGELRLKHGQAELAEADLRNSVALAQKMSAKSWELRATMSLARLLSKQNRRNEAGKILTQIYNWFTDGFDTADLKDAKALLDELTA